MYFERGQQRLINQTQRRRAGGDIMWDRALTFWCLTVVY